MVFSHSGKNHVTQQARDYAAALFAGDDGRWTRIQRLQSHAAVILELFKVRDYANAITLSKLQFAHLERVNHPAYRAVQHDPMLLAEDRGEQSLAGVATATNKLTYKSDVGELSKSYQLQHAMRAVSHQAMHNMGLSLGRRNRCGGCRV